jgi:hypothetical protein
MGSPGFSLGPFQRLFPIDFNLLEFVRANGRSRPEYIVAFNPILPLHMASQNGPTSTYWTLEYSWLGYA